MTFLTVKEKVQKIVFHLIVSFHNSTYTSTAEFYRIQIEVNPCQKEISKLYRGTVLCSLEVGVNVEPL